MNFAKFMACVGVLCALSTAVFADSISDFYDKIGTCTKSNTMGVNIKGWVNGKCAIDFSSGGNATSTITDPKTGRSFSYKQCDYSKQDLQSYVFISKKLISGANLSQQQMMGLNDELFKLITRSCR